MTGRALVPLIGLMLLVGCGGDGAAEREESTERADTAVEPGAQAAPPDTLVARDTATRAPAQDTAQFAGTTAATHRPGTGRPQAILRAARIAGHAGYDRIVFEFEGPSVPGYHVEYRDTPVRRCGSGDVVELPGAGRLVVRLEPARAHDGGSSTIAARTMSPALSAVRRMILICDFEGQVTWAIGVPGVVPYRVMEESQPARLIIDVRHQR
jgi:hypothetical protein